MEVRKLDRAIAIASVILPLVLSVCWAVTTDRTLPAPQKLTAIAFGTVFTAIFALGIFFGKKWAFAWIVFMSGLAVIERFFISKHEPLTFVNVLAWLVEVAVTGYCIWRLATWNRVEVAKSHGD